MIWILRPIVIYFILFECRRNLKKNKFVVSLTLYIVLGGANKQLVTTFLIGLYKLK
jgi:hypothetical protein